MIDLTKKVVDLSKTARTVADQKGVDTPAQVIAILDISKSMNRLYKDGRVQAVLERLLPLAMALDDDGAIDIILFGSKAYSLPSISLDDIENYVEREILPNYRIIEATRYSEPLKLIQSNADFATSALPALVIFITDGNNSDKKESTELIRTLSNQPIFFQFVGIGSERFAYLEKLDELSDRVVDNAGFFSVESLSEMSDLELYQSLLSEFPDWINDAKKNNIIQG